MTNVACAHVKRKKWVCSSQCEPVTDTVVDAILTLKAAFDKPIQEYRHTLDNVIVSHYCKVINFPLRVLGGLFQISSDGCQSQLSISCSPCMMYTVCSGTIYQKITMLTRWMPC